MGIVISLLTEIADSIFATWLMFVWNWRKERWLADEVAFAELKASR